MSALVAQTPETADDARAEERQPDGEIPECTHIGRIGQRNIVLRAGAAMGEDEEELAFMPLG
jgi:hypothetical protein